MSQFGKQYFGNETDRLSSSVEERGAYAMGSVCASRGDSAGCTELLNELSIVLGGMMMNAQVMQWKLPAYSHSKRYLREIERSAQRGGSLVKQLMSRVGGLGQGDEVIGGEAPSLAGAGAVTAQEPNVGDDLADQGRALAHAAPAFSPRRSSRTHTCL